MKISFTVQSVAVVKDDLIQIRLKNNEISSFRPDKHLQPVMKDVPQQVSQMILQMNKGILQQVGQPDPSISVWILTEEQYDAMGRPSVKDVLRMDVSKS